SGETLGHWMPAPVPTGTSAVLAPTLAFARSNAKLLSEPEVRSTYASLVPSAEKLGEPRVSASRPLLATSEPSEVLYMPGCAPGGPGTCVLPFSTMYLPFGDSAEFDQRR